MDKAHRDILGRHCEDIVENLIISDVKQSLIKRRVFDSQQWDSIKTAGGGTERDKASALMDRLPKHRPEAFWCFCEALMTSGYDFLGKPLIEEGVLVNIPPTHLPECHSYAQHVIDKHPTHNWALSLRQQIDSIRTKYHTCITKEGEAVLKALKIVGKSQKVRGRKESEQKLTSWKQITEAIKNFEEKNSSKQKDPCTVTLNPICKLVEKLKNIKDELQKHGPVPEYVNEMNSLLADFSTIYDMTLNKGHRLDYLKDLRMQGVADPDIRNFGSVLILIPYLCDRSEEAIGVIFRRPLSPPSQLEDESSDPEEQNGGVNDEQETGSEDTLDGAVGPSDGLISQVQVQNQQAMAFMLKEFRELHSKVDQVNNTVKKQTKLLQQTEDIKGRLTAIFSQLEGIGKALDQWTGTATALELETRVSSLKERVGKLLIQKIDTTTLEKIEDIESEVVQLLQQFKEVDNNVKVSLTQMNSNLHQLKTMLLTLTVESQYVNAADQPELSDAIKIVTKEFGSKDCTKFARKLDPKIDTISCVPPGHLVPQMSELLKLWREKNGSNATLEVLERTCRKSGLQELADKISRTPGASSSASGTNLLRSPRQQGPPVKFPPLT